ncbi:hypothetical protein [Roseococcus suduntuyensis]|uniref:Uncharacterized protein n=1 Tax=Roseococcus suduntuyensis TaxID=455361 RepID=A0A840AHZ0_9PROT|nr:hypothetical protein [Roseococcus suduntuyensis]MBB3900100.1 hypothetical protein [Roseococcus suduntuyensis]
MSAQAALEAVIAEHLPAARDGAPSDADEALLLRLAIVGNGRFKVMDKAKELARLADVHLAATALRNALDSLDLNARHALTQAAMAVPSRALRQPRRAGGGFTFADVLDLPEVLRHAAPAAREVIQAASEAGGTKWRAVSLLMATRELWARRQPKPPPRHPNPATRFGRFAQDVFDAAGLDAKPKHAAAAAIEAGVLS